MMRTMLVSIMLTALLAVHPVVSPPAVNGDRPCLDAALEAARWILSSTVRTRDGFVWPVAPEESPASDITLYSGSPGVVLFLLEAFDASEREEYVEAARVGADHLAAIMRDVEDNGLYTGLAGIGFALEETFKSTGDRKYRRAFLDCLEILRARAVSTGSGIEWSPTADIIGGTAGIGLLLLYAAEELGDQAWIDLASRSGRRLVELGLEVEGGTKWAMDPEFPRLMPNFSHGTAGIAYFLASLAIKTGEKEFLDAALAGARYLTAVAETDNGACFVFHHEPGGEDLFYLGWCHGPVGTARLFDALFRATGDRSWRDWTERCARGIIDSGIPETDRPGFWNNEGQCCGSAGVAEFMLSLHRMTKKSEYLDFAERLTTRILSSGTKDETGLHWAHAEHRARPDFVQAQTGLMQGAAGIGMWLLRLDAFRRGKHPRIALPDDPFRTDSRPDDPSGLQERGPETIRAAIRMER